MLKKLVAFSEGYVPDEEFSKILCEYNSGRSFDCCYSPKVVEYVMKNATATYEGNMGIVGSVTDDMRGGIAIVLEVDTDIPWDIAYDMRHIPYINYLDYTIDVFGRMIFNNGFSKKSRE